MPTPLPSRRDLLAAFLVGVPAAAFGCLGPSRASGRETDTQAEPATEPVARCVPTERNIEGPFYRPRSPERSNLDLYGDPGQKLHVSGQLLAADCRTPIVGAQIEAWHANPDGGYDTDGAEMRYYGHVVTGADGRWGFRTLMPGRYLNGARYRPAHVHLKVFDAGRERLTTQLYFEGDKWIAGDAFVRQSLIRPLIPEGDGSSAAFDIVLGT